MIPLIPPTVRFIIFHRTIQGTPNFIYPYDGRLAACVTLSINICRNYLCHPKVQAALLSFAEKEDRFAPKNAWYKDPVHGYRSREGAVWAFINIILATFPMVGVDDSIRNPGCLAAVVKREHDHFDPLDHPILLNGPRVADMVAAATKARDYASDHNYKQFRTFLFIFANVLFHEVCHLLSTFLSKGRHLTPPHINAEIPGYSSKNRGEAGRYVETIVFGGTLEFIRDPTLNDRQSGIPCLCTTQGLRRITQASIDAMNRHEHHFPYSLEGPYIKPEDTESLGKHHALPDLTDPMDWHVMQQFKRYKHIATFHPDPFFQRPPFFPDLGAQGAATRAP